MAGAVRVAGYWRIGPAVVCLGDRDSRNILFLAFLFLAVFFETRAFAWLRQAIAPMLAVPHAAAAFALAFLIAPSGFLARLLSPWATGWQRPPDLLILQDAWGLSLMAGLVMKEVPFLLLIALAPLAQIHASERMRLARSIGYGRVSAWFKSVVPALYPLLRLPLYAVIAYSSANIDVALILGRSLRRRSRFRFCDGRTTRSLISG